MNNLRFLGLTAVTLAFIGCVSAEKINPSDVANFKNPNSLIAAKNLNGKDDKGKEFMLTEHTKDALLPYAYMKNLCISQGGTFKQASHSLYGYLDKTNNQGNVAQSPELAHAIGIFRCESRQPWNIAIEPISSRVNYKQGLRFVTLKSFIASDWEAQSLAKSYKEQTEMEQRRKELQIQRHNQEIQRKAAEYQRNLTVNAPTRNDIGQTLCKETPLSSYTGYIVMGQPTFNQVNGTVIASLEGFSNDGTNLRLNIKGWLSDHNQIGSGSNVLYKQTPLESGRVIWDNKQNWYKCNY